MHPLLAHQLEQYVGASAVVPAEWQSLLDAVGDAYTQADADRESIRQQSAALLDVIQSVALGDMDVKVQIPEGEGILVDLAIGIQMMVDDIREMLAEQERAKQEAERARQELIVALQEVLAVQRRYVREGWEVYTALSEDSRGYAIEEGADKADDLYPKEGPTDEAWLPAMTQAAQRAEVVVASGQKAGSTLALPVELYGQILGVLGFRREGSEGWSEGEIEVVRGVAAQMAQALENQRLLDEQQRASALMGKRVKEVDCLSDIGRRVDERPPIPSFLQWVAGRVPLAMQYPDLCRCAVQFAGQVYGASQAIDLPWQMVQGLRIGEKMVGQVSVAYAEERPFLDEESALLGDVARRVSGYIENRQLLQETQARAEQERLVRTATDRIRRGVDAEAVMRIGLEELSRMLGTSKMVLRLGTLEQLRAGPVPGRGQDEE